ncbi:MAG: DUF4234 domain-containing protein [Acutalibacteraceae bacterium]|nr:DUF4234 domain-containing protein [Acutalibacteraceae bacterium]
MKKREIALCIVLSLVTCGIYSLIWLAFMVNDLRELANEQDKMGGGLVVLLSIVTCGIYGIYWYYQAGKSIEKAKYMRNISSDNATGLIYLLLGVFGLGIVSMCLIQNEINNLMYIPPVNNGNGFENQNSYYGNSQPYDNQNYYNTDTNYNQNQNYDNQGYNQNNYNDPNNTNN